MHYFPELPDTSRVWVFAAASSLSADQRHAVVERMQCFISDWKSHGRPVNGDVTFLDDRLLVVAAHIEDGPNAGVSGCGIDAMTDAAEDVATDLGFSWIDGLDVVYRDAESELQAVPRSIFRREIAHGQVDASTPVIDTTVTDLKTLRSSGVEMPAGESWHARVFRLEPQSATP